MAVSSKWLLAALALTTISFESAKAEENGIDFVGVAAESLCLASLENRTRPDVWISQHGPQLGLVQVDRSQLPAPVAHVGWRGPSDLYVIDHGFGACAINVDRQRIGAQAAMLAAMSAHLPALENLTSRGIVQEDVSNLFCGDRPFGSIFAYVTTSGTRLVLMTGIDRQSCAESMEFFLGASPPEQRSPK